MQRIRGTVSQRNSPESLAAAAGEAARRSGWHGGTRQPARATSALTSNDLATLTVLGTVFEGYRSYSQILTAARSIASADWQPTGDLVAGALAKAIEVGHLRICGRDRSVGTGMLAISAAGKAHLRELLSRSSPRCRDSIGRVATSLKVCFLGALEADGACALLDDLSSGHLRELQSLRRGCEACPAARSFAGLCVGREIERLEQELAWLARVRAGLTNDEEKESGTWK